MPLIPSRPRDASADDAASAPTSDASPIDWTAALGGRRPDGTLRDGPAGLTCPLGRLVVSASASAVAHRDACEQDAAERRAYRQAIPAPAPVRPSPHAALLAALGGRRHRVRRAA